MKAEILAVPALSAEQDWVEGELVRSLMRTQRSTQWLALLLVAIVVGILSDDNDPQRLVAWVLLWGAAAMWRVWVIYQYQTYVAPLPTGEHMAFFRQHRFVWPVSALVWGLATELYFDRAPLGDQYICWLIMAGLAMFSINSLCARLRVMRAYLDILAGTALAVMAWRMFVDLRLQGPAYHWWVGLLLLIFWQVLRHAGERLHITLRRNFELQFRNMQLIESLTRQTQAALDAVEIKNRFLASAAHDIRQPVHALGLYADWLRGEPELVHELAPKIVDATKAVNHLFDSLFDLARLDSGKVRLNVEPVDMVKLMRNLELQYRPVCEAKGLSFRLHVCPGTVHSDPILLQRIVGNLVSNAIRYTHKGGVLVASRRSREGLLMEIWDTGIGIAPAHHREIFREFYKVPGHAGTADGFGLGLYIVSRLTHILGHPLSLQSRMGRGTVFRLLLEPTDPREAGERALASMTQMIPEDDGLEGGV
jgi:signal transduction histidine kinase